MRYWMRTLVVTALQADAEKAVAAHRAHLRDLKSDGRLRIAGALRRGEGFMDVFEAIDRLEAEAVTRRSPLVADGLASWTLREWEEIDP